MVGVVLCRLPLSTFSVLAGVRAPYVRGGDRLSAATRVVKSSSVYIHRRSRVYLDIFHDY